MFNHPSEQQFANLLDFLNTRWIYERITFVLKRDEEGQIVRAFTPDFYLPEIDVYIELTSQPTHLCTRKRRKIREAKEIYNADVVLINRDGLVKLMDDYPHIFNGTCINLKG